MSSVPTVASRALKSAIYFPVLGVFTLYTALTSVPFLLLRHVPSVKHRNVSLTMAAVTFASMLVLFELATEPFRSTIPCFVFFWTESILAPLCIAPLLARFVQLAFAYRAGEEALATARERRGSTVNHGNNNNNGELAEPEKSLQGRKASYAPGDSQKPGRGVGGALGVDANSEWWTRNRRQVSNASVVYYVCMLLLVYAPILFTVQVLSRRLKATPLGTPHPVCNIGWEYSPAAVIVGAQVLVIFPILTVAFRRVADAFGIWIELVLSAVVWLFVLAGYTALAVFLPDTAKEYTSPGVVLCAGVVVVHYLLVIRPVWLHYHLRKGWRMASDTDKAKAGTRKAFEIVLNDPNMFDDFKTFAVQDFSVENALFFERVARVRRNPPRSEELLIKEQRKIYYLFLRDRADLQLSIADRTIRAVQTDIKLGKHRPELFDAALEEVLVLLYSETFPRFLQTRRPEFRADLAKRAGLQPGMLFGG